MENYKIQKRLGDGTYGCVFKATNTKTGEIVAIKKFKRKYASWDECMQLREIKALRKLAHQNIIKLKEVLKVSDELNLVFEFLEKNVFEAYMEYKNKNEKMSESQIRSIIRQVVEGLAYMHKHGYFHRQQLQDLKPENLLMYGETVKICDFGLAREIRSRPPYTDYVATRWYRAPEILLKQTNYNSPVDIFALGCIMAELYMLAPLFSGQSELDQLFKIAQILGTPTTQAWPDAQKLANQINFTFPQCQPVSLEKIIPNCSQDALQVIQDMLRYDPQKRPSAQQLLSYPYFTQTTPIPQSLPQVITKHRPKAEPKQDTRNQFYDMDLENIEHKYQKAEPLYPKQEVSKRKDDKFRDSTSNFLELLDQKLAENDNQWNIRPDKKKDTQTKLQGTREKFQQKPIPLHHQNSNVNNNQGTQQQTNTEEMNDKELFQEEQNQNNKRNNPFKLLKYNDPIMNGQMNLSNQPPQNYDHHALSVPKQQKPLSMVHSNQLQYQLPYLPPQGKSTLLPRVDPLQQNMYQNLTKKDNQYQPPIGGSKLPIYYQSKIQQNYGRLNDGGYGGGGGARQGKVDEFGFTKQNKYSYM